MNLRCNRSVAVLLSAGILCGCRTTPASPPTPQEAYEGLLKAAGENRADEIRRLVALGADPDWLPPRNDSFHMPLMVASAQGHVEAVDALLAAGANPNMRESGNTSGMTPLMAAADAGH